MAPPVATPTPRRLSTDTSNGFTMLYEKLDALFHQQFRAKNVQATAEGVAKKARQRLHSVFTAPIGRSSTNSSNATAVSLTPPTNHSTPHVVSARSSSSNIDTPEDKNLQERLDERLVPFSLTRCGVRRLSIIDILQLKVGDQFTLVIPTEHRESKTARSYRSGLRDLLKSSIHDFLP
jgi:hypothetical protein